MARKSVTSDPRQIEKQARISPCGKYRWWLRRSWDLSKRTAVFVMLNPSTADASVDDPTIRRCVNFAKNWGYGGLNVVNLFALRATDPAELLTSDVDPIGPGNYELILEQARPSEVMVAAWGSKVPKQLASHVDRVEKALVRRGAVVMCLKKNKDGSPGHPLYVPGTAGLIPYLETLKEPHVLFE